MEVSGTAASITVNAYKELSKQILKIAGEIIKILLINATRDTDKAKAGKNTIQKLFTGGNRINAPIQLDQQDVKRFYQLAKEHHLPVAVIKGAEGKHRAFFREGDLGRVSELMKEMIMEKSKQEPGLQKTVILEKGDAKLFKTRAKEAGLQVSFFDTNSNLTKVEFKEQDISKVKGLLEELNKAKEIQHSRILETQGNMLSIKDTELNRTLQMGLPITKSAFEKNVISALGYTKAEASDLSNQLEAKKNWLWKPDYKAQFSQLVRMEKEIKLQKDPDEIKDYSFSTLTLADGKDTKMMTVIDKDAEQVYSTQPLKRAVFIKEVQEHLGVSEAIAKMLADKAEKIGFIEDARQMKKGKAINEVPILESIEISKSANNSTVTFSSDGKTFKADFNNKDATLKGLESTFSVDNKTAAQLYEKAEKQGVKEVIKTVERKATAQNQQIHSIVPMEKSKQSKVR